MCDHYETRTRADDCEECHCADCPEQRPAREIARNGGLCDDCFDKADD